MGKNKKYFVFTDCDLDGAGSYMMFPWFTGYSPPRITTRVNDFESKYKAWIAAGNLSKYDRVFILDLDVSRFDDIIDMIDNDKVTIIDHHDTHEPKYKHAKSMIEPGTSCTKKMYNLFKKNGSKLTTEQKMLVAMIDDYDSYELKIPHSYHLNLLFWNYQGDRLEKFYNDFKHGYRGFDESQNKIIKFYERKLENIKRDLEVHWAQIPIKNKKYKFVSVFANECINEVADFIIQNYKADVGLVINLNSNKVSLRKRKECELNLGKMATQLFDEGGGHEDASGGLLCDSFLKFSSLFKPITGNTK